MAAEIWLTEKYYKDFHEREDSLFSDVEGVDVYKKSQLLHQRWPGCIGNPPPEIGSKSALFYMKFDWPKCRLRLCFGAMSEGSSQIVVALTCRTKQELSKGSFNRTTEWYRHMAITGVARWDDYRRSHLKSWRIYP